MLSVTPTVSTWPSEVLKFTYPKFVSGLNYQLCPQFADTISTDLDEVHGWVNLATPLYALPSIVHNSASITEINAPVSASPAISYNGTIPTLSSSLFYPYNDHACMTLRAFAPYNPAAGATISPEFTAIIAPLVPVSAKEIVLETTTLEGGSGSYVMPSHLIYTDSRLPSAINQSHTLMLTPTLRQWQHYYYGTYKSFLGTANATPYSLPFVNYANFAFSPLVTSNLSASQVATLNASIQAPTIYQHVAGVSSLSPTTNGASAYTANLLGSLSGINYIKPGSVLFKVGYYDPAITSDRYTSTQIYAATGNGIGNSLPTLSSDSIYDIIRNEYRTGFIRDVPAPSAVNPVSAALVGRAGTTSDIFVNSAISFVNYQTGDFAIYLNNGHTFNGNATAPLYYNRAFIEFGGYPAYNQFNVNPIDQKSCIYNPVRLVGNGLNASFDMAVSDLSSVVDLNDYPTFGSKLATTTASGNGVSNITYNTYYGFQSVSAVSFSSVNNVPSWLYTYQTSISAAGNPCIVNGLDMNFNILSADTSVSSNSAIITPLIVSNYGTTTCAFSTNDAYYGYLQLECPGAIEEANRNTQAHSLSVYVLDSNNVPVRSYPIKTNALDLSMPYDLKSYGESRSVALSTLVNNIQSDTVPITLQTVAHYYGDTLPSILNANKISVQLYAANNAIKTTHADSTLSFMGNTQDFVNKLYKYVNECINPSNMAVSNLADIQNEIQYKFNNCGNIYKSFYEIFSDVCRSYVNNAVNASNEFIIPASTITLCTEIGASLGALAVTNNNAIGFDIASNLFNIKNIIDGTTDTAAYNFILDALTESFIMATWPGSFDIANVLNQNEITYNPGNFSIIKKVISLRMESIFNYFNFALSSARNAGVITPDKYNEIIGYYSTADYHLFNAEVLKIKSLIDYDTLVAATLNKQYVANSNKNTGYYLFKAETELGNIFEYLYDINAIDHDTLYSSLYSTLKLDEYGVQNVIVSTVTRNTLIDRTTNTELFASNSLAAINTQFTKNYYTSELIPLSSRFCIVSPISGSSNATYKLNMYSNVVGSSYIDIQNPTAGIQNYVLKNARRTKKALVYSKPSFILNKPSISNSVGVTFTKPISSNDVVSAYVNIPPGLIPAKEAVKSTIFWDVSFQGNDSDYAKTWLSDTVGTTPFLSSGTHSFITTALAVSAIGSNLLSAANANNIVYKYNNIATLNKIGVNPITVSVSVSSSYLSTYGSSYITSNMLTGIGTFIPDLGQMATAYTFDSALTSAYPANAITSNLSVVSADYAAIDNPILLKNYFIKNSRIYTPPINEFITLNLESVYAASRLFRISAPGAPEVEIQQGSQVRNAPYFKVKSIMPKTLGTFAPTKDNLRITAYSTPASIKNAPQLSATLNFFPHPSNLYSKFDIVATATSGTSSISATNTSVNTDLLVALTASSDPYRLDFKPQSNPYMTFNWSVSSLPTTAYSISSDVLSISSQNFSAISGGVAIITLSTVFNYLNGVTKAVLVSDPLYIYTSNQVVSALDARMWTVNNFTSNGMSAVNSASARTVNTNLTSVGNGHIETLVLSTMGTPFEKYVWQLDNSIPYVTSLPSTSAKIIGVEGSTYNVSITGFNLALSTSPLLNSLSAYYDNSRTLVINPRISEGTVFENENYSISTSTSAITSSYFKPLEFLQLDTPTISSNFDDEVRFFTDSVNLEYDTAINVTHTHGERVLSASTTVAGSIKDLDTGLVRFIEPTTYALASGINLSALNVPIIGNLDLFNCSLLTLSSFDTIYTGVSGSSTIFKTSVDTRVNSLTSIKLPELNVFWNDAYYQVGDSLVIKNNNDFSRCYGLDIGFESLSVTFNNQTQVVPASTSHITFNNLDDTGIYSIEISGNTLSALSASYPIISKVYDNAITVVNSFDTFNPSARVINETLALPYSLNEIFIAPNDFIVASNINASLTKLHKNYQYLKDKAEFNDTKLPVGFNKWLGSLENSYNKWRYVDRDWADTFRSINTNEFTQILSVRVTKNDKLIVAERLSVGNDRISMYDFDLLSKNIGNKTSIISEDKFGKIVAMDIDSDNRLYVLDGLNNSVYVFDLAIPAGLATFTLTKTVGGLGNGSRPYRFKDPTDIHISESGTIYITDTGNDVVKVYNDKLIHLFNVSHSDWILQNDIVSVSTTTSNIYVLRSNGSVYVFDNNGAYQNSYTTIPNPFNGTPRKIHCNNIDNGIIYIVNDTHVSKITVNGVYIGYFKPIYTPYVDSLCCIEQFDRNILIGDRRAVYNTIDFVSLKNILTPIDELEWKLDDILIQDNDLVQDWVYNTVFNRLRDNFELYVKNLHSKYVFDIDINGRVIANIIQMPTAELPVLVFDQSQIGQNELVFADVLNRVLKQMYENQEAILISIESTIKTNLCADNWCWSWASLGSVDPIKKNCQVNPISFIELRSNSPGIGGRTWNQLTNTTTCCEIVSS